MAKWFGKIGYSNGTVERRGSKDEVFPSIIAGATPGCKCITYHEKKGQ